MLMWEYDFSTFTSSKFKAVSLCFLTAVAQLRLYKKSWDMMDYGPSYWTYIMLKNSILMFLQRTKMLKIVATFINIKWPVLTSLEDLGAATCKLVNFVDYKV